MFKIITLIIALCLVIAGTGILWNIRNVWFPVDSQELLDNTFAEVQNQVIKVYNWNLVQFWVIWTFAALGVYTKNNIFGVFAAGITVLLAVNTGEPNANFFSFPSINQCRVVNSRSEYATSESANPNNSAKNCAGGGVLVWASVLLALLVSFTPFRISEVNMKQKIQVFFTTVASVIGLIILWTSSGASPPTGGAYGKMDSLYGVIMDMTTIAFFSTFYSVCATFNLNNIPFRAAAAFYAGFAQFAMLRYTFIVVAYHIATPNDRTAQSTYYAGGLFLWFSMLVNVLLGYCHFKDNDNKVTSSA